MSGRVSSFPFLMFHDEPVKVLRIILRECFIAETRNGPFYMKQDGFWTNVSKYIWFDRIYERIDKYCKSHNMAISDKKAISKAISFLYNENAHKRVCRSLDRSTPPSIFRINHNPRRVITM